MAIIYPTYACNHKCPHCLYAGWNNGHHYPYEEFKSLIGQLSDIGVKGIEFCGGGEPTLYPKFREIIEYAIKLNMDLGILTNGSTLKNTPNCLLITSGMSV
jgi:Predicted Fe-S oxidoreductases